MFSPPLPSRFGQAKDDDVPRSASSIGREPATASRGGRSTRRFIVHYAEMVAVMFAGMFALMTPTGVLLGAFGTSWSRLSPAMYTFVMALTMTVPMVAWMRFRGHAWRPNIEMAASMLIPTFAVMGVQGTGLANGGLTIPEHAGMLTFMLIAMLLRRDEYSSAAHHHGHPRAAIAA